MARPAKISDDDLLQLIAELRTRGGAPTGTAVRNELTQRFGIRAGCDRVYRLLRIAMASSSRSPTTRSPPATVAETASVDLAHRIAELEAALAAAIERAERAEHRERTHQDHWAQQIYELRQENLALRKAWSR